MSSVFPITDDPRYRRYTASPGQKAFSVPFPFLQEDDVKVYLQVSDGTYNIISQVDYALTGSGSPSGGSVVFTIGRSGGEVILILGDAVLDRMSSIVKDGKFSSALTEGEFDRIRIIEQELRRDIQRAMKTDYGGQGISIQPDIPDKSVLYLEGNTIKGGALVGDLDEYVGEARSYSEAAQAAQAAAAASAAQADASAQQSTNAAGQAQILVNAAQAGYTGFQPGTFYDLGRLEDELTLFPGDLGRLEDL